MVKESNQIEPDSYRNHLAIDTLLFVSVRRTESHFSFVQDMIHCLLKSMHAPRPELVCYDDYVTRQAEEMTIAQIKPANLLE